MQSGNGIITGRFAPSPTGALHTGSLVAAVGSWLMAKSAGGRWLLRMDDLDTPRQVAGMADDIQRTLERFGLLWDGEISWQSRHLDAYRQAFEQLQQQGVIYPCCCSRKEIAQAVSAPHPDDDTVPYFGICRNGMRPVAPIRSWRVRVTDDEISFDDRCQGHVSQNLWQGCGDFTVRRGDGEFAYQLAVVVDDALTGVNQVVRGSDLLSSTSRQMYIQRLLGLPLPTYCHLPLVTGPGGEKLSKRDNLVSNQLGNFQGRESELLLNVLRFLGQKPPRGLMGAACKEILQWGIAHFDVANIPQYGCELQAR
jgi:glutamyl-Q tRNA(Asp) synthetase